MLILFLCFSIQSVSANLSVGATPLRTVLELDPGKSTSFEIKAINRNAVDMVYGVELQVAEPEGVSGNARFIEVNPLSNNELPNWITVDKTEVAVPANDMKPFTFTVSVPKDAIPGGYYAMAIFSPKQTAGEGGNVAIVGQVGTPILLKVRGDVIEEADVTNFGVDLEHVAEGQPIPLLIQFENKGNVHILPEGQITLFESGEQLRNIASIKMEDGSTKMVDYIPINPGMGYTLPKSTRIYTPEWEYNKKYTNLTAKYQLRYGKETTHRLEGEAKIDIHKNIVIDGFTYSDESKKFSFALKNIGKVQMPVRGQINIYSNAGGDPKVTLSFPEQTKELSFVKGDTTETVEVAWEGYEYLHPSEDNQYNAIVTYVLDLEQGRAVTAKINLPYPGMPVGLVEIDIATLFPYIVIALLLVIILFLFLKREKRK